MFTIETQKTITDEMVTTLSDMTADGFARRNDATNRQDTANHLKGVDLRLIKDAGGNVAGYGVTRRLWPYCV